MKYRIESKPAFLVAGKSLFTPDSLVGPTLHPHFWLECINDGTLDRLMELGSNTVTGKDNILGVCYGHQSDGSYRYMIGIAVEGVPVPPDIEVIKIPASTWAIFEAVGALPDAINAVWKSIFTEFLPNSDYRHAGTPDFEWNPPGGNDENYHSEVWIPVIKK